MASNQSQEPPHKVGDELPDDYVQLEIETRTSEDNSNAACSSERNGDTAEDDAYDLLIKSLDNENGKRSRIASVAPKPPKMKFRRQEEDSAMAPELSNNGASEPAQEVPTFSDAVPHAAQEINLPVVENEPSDDEDIEVELINAGVETLSSSSSEEAIGFDLCSSPSIQYTQKVALACENLRSACNDVIVTCTGESSCLLKFAAACPEQASSCYKLSGIYFMLSAFSSQFYSAIHELSQIFSKLSNYSYKTEKLSRDLVNVINEVTIACEMLAVDGKDIYSSFLNAVSPIQYQSSSNSEKSDTDEPIAADSDEEFGIKISQLHMIATQIGVTMGQLKTSHRLLEEVECEGKPQRPRHLYYESLSPTISPLTDGFLQISVEIASVERRVTTVVDMIKRVRKSKNPGNTDL